MPPAYDAVVRAPAAAAAAISQQRQREPQRAVQLSESEADTLEELATLASIFRATEALEKFFTRNKITADDYTRECSLLITQFRAQEKCLISRKIIPNINSFVKQYLTETTDAVAGPRITCDRAYNRLVMVGQPETVINAVLSSHKIKPSDIADVTSSLITSEDAVALGSRDVTTLLPLLAQVRANLGRINGLKPDHPAKVKMLQWIEKLQVMRADADISEEDKASLGLDLEMSKQAWAHFLADLS